MTAEPRCSDLPRPPEDSPQDNEREFLARAVEFAEVARAGGNSTCAARIKDPASPLGGVQIFRRFPDLPGVSPLAYPDLPTISINTALCGATRDPCFPDIPSFRVPAMTASTLKDADLLKAAASEEHETAAAKAAVNADANAVQLEAMHSEFSLLDKSAQTDPVIVLAAAMAWWSSTDGDSLAEAMRTLKLLAERGPQAKIMASLDASVASLETQLAQERQRTEDAQRQFLCLEAELDRAEAALASSDQMLQRRELELKLAHQLCNEVRSTVSSESASPHHRRKSPMPITITPPCELKTDREGNSSRDSDREVLARTVGWHEVANAGGRNITLSPSLAGSPAADNLKAARSVQVSRLR